MNNNINISKMPPIPNNNSLANGSGALRLQGEAEQQRAELLKVKKELLFEKERREKDIKELADNTKELTDSKHALLNILDDIEAERRIAEEERDKTSAVIKSLPDGMIIIEKENVNFINPKAESILGISGDTIVGRNLWELSSSVELGKLVGLLKQYSLDLTRQELIMKEDLVLEVSTNPVIKEGLEVGKMIVLHDITREKAVEKMKTEFVTITAHQLRTPLSAIKWIMDMMLEGDLGQISESQKDFIRKTYQSNERMIRLVNDLLNVTRIEEGRFLYDLKPKNIIELAEKITGPLKDLATKRNLKFVFEKPLKEVPPIYIDEEKFGIVLQNLLDNAIYYTKEGKVVLSIAYDGKKEEVYFMVKDDGIGIPQEQQKRVFSRFFRAPNALKTDTEGTGLGLFIAKNIIEAHGGKIWFESQEGKGTSFYFVVPRDARKS